jgi:hypothetical protein
MGHLTRHSGEREGLVLSGSAVEASVPLADRSDFVLRDEPATKIRHRRDFVAR